MGRRKRSSMRSIGSDTEPLREDGQTEETQNGLLFRQHLIDEIAGDSKSQVPEGCDALAKLQQAFIGGVAQDAKRAGDDQTPSDRELACWGIISKSALRSSATSIASLSPRPSLGASAVKGARTSTTSIHSGEFNAQDLTALGAPGAVNSMSTAVGSSTVP
jgi:hypothetical protein